MTEFFVHGIEGESEEGEPFVQLTTPVGLSDTYTRNAFETIANVQEIAPEVTLYKLVAVGALRDGIPD